MLEFLIVPFILFWTSELFVSSTKIEFFPEENKTYHSISSDRPKNQLSVAKFPSSTIDHAGNARYALMLGDLFTLFRQEHSDFKIDYTFGGGLYQQFDLTRGLDGVGSNGTIYSMMTTSYNNFEFDLAVVHLSGHLLDEYIENTDRKRIEYARNEYLIGLRWNGDFFLNHIEVGFDYSENQATPNKPWRIRNEFQYYIDRSNRLQSYLAFDLEAKEENAWRINTTIQTGLAINTDKRERFRTYLEYYTGNSKLSEFYKDQETMISIGFIFRR